MHFKLLLLFSLLISIGNISAQEIHRCHTDHKMEILFEENPEYEDEIEAGFVNFNRGLTKPANRNMVITIPVHVVIVHPPGVAVGSGNNLSLAHVLSQIDVLNDDFRRFNADAANTPAVFPAGDSGIEFCLASVDPNGNATDGITRYATNQDFDNNEFSIKSATGWDRNTYLNMWVAPIGALGYAYLPTQGSLPNSTLDGVVVTTGAFGGPGFAWQSPYDLGRTATHEVGHFLGLRHVWRNNGCGSDDGINDTPLQDNSNFGCPNHPSPSCGNSGDMFMNYMDYVNDNCMNAFSVEQGNYMNAILGTSRAALAGASSFACGAGSTPLSIGLIEATDPLCFGGLDGYIAVEATGGSGTYTYTLNNGVSSVDGQFFNLFPGVYIVSVSDGTNSVDIEVTLMEPELLEAFLGNSVDNQCADSNQGYLQVIGLGGTAPNGAFLYQLDQGELQESNEFNNLASGTYVLTVYDENDCSAFAVGNVLSPDSLLLSYGDTLAISCSGDSLGAITLSASGGVPGYEYAIDGGDYQSSAIFDSLYAGQYIASIKDANGCITEDTFNFEEPSLLEVSAMNVTEPNCFGQANGSMTVIASGGTPGYQYAINGQSVDTSYIENLMSGNYIVSVIDTNGCMSNDTVEITQPNQLTSSVLEISQVICPGSQDGFITIEAAGGSGPYNYSLNGVTNTTGQFINIMSGAHTVVITDANDCEITSDHVIDISPEISSMDEFTDPLCNGSTDGSIVINGSGGTGALMYSIDGGSFVEQGNFLDLTDGEYNIIIKDAIGCEQSITIELNEPEAITTDVSVAQDPCGISQEWSLGLSIAGGTPDYTLNINGTSITVDGSEDVSLSGLVDLMGMIEGEDNNGCVINIPYEVELIAPIQVEIQSSQPANCDSTVLGMIEVSAMGGTPPYTYQLGNQENTNGTFDNLFAGFYSMNVYDAIDCQFVLNFAISTDANGFEISAVDIQDLNCFEDQSGTINAQISGGQGPFTYTLNGDTNDTGVFSDLPAGQYTVFVFDEGSDCNLSSDFEITQPTMLTGDVDVIHGAYEGENKVVINPNGGTPPYQYALDNMNDLGDSNTFTRLTTGSHTVYILDANDCIYEEVVGITSTYNSSLEDNVLIYPNPADDVINIRLPDHIKDLYEIELMDLQGQVIQKSQHNINVGNNNIHTFLVNNLATSIYIVKIAVGNEIMYRKILVR